MRLFILGIPACGKTTFSRWLVSERGFVRCPSTEEPSAFFVSEIERALEHATDIVIDYGFPEGGFPIADALIGAGFEFWWFDGDRTASLEAFIARPGHPATPQNYADYMAHIERNWPWYQARFGDRRLDVIGPGPAFMSNEDRWAAICAQQEGA